VVLLPKDLESREAEAIIIVKAAPQAGQKHGEVVCCAGIGPRRKMAQALSGILQDFGRRTEILSLGSD
jgi:hypothetical protein